MEGHSVYYFILLYTVYKLRVHVQTISTTYTFSKRKQFECIEDQNDIVIGITPIFPSSLKQVIKNGKSCYAKTCSKYRENGDYATKDLFSKSKIVKNGYNYAGRDDDILVMSNGENTNPISMEDITRSSPLVSNCTVIAEGQERAG
ncbi:hypothetical protein BD770DRAFT_424866 [Pilaira anomala]|nr:hypothetical protein BD770DRAFT_424866 [Pilaira anomala]